MQSPSRREKGQNKDSIAPPQMKNTKKSGRNFHSARIRVQLIPLISVLFVVSRILFQINRQTNAVVCLQETVIAESYMPDI